jgi:hypothetical protein
MEQTEGVHAELLRVAAARRARAIERRDRARQRAAAARLDAERLQRITTDAMARAEMIRQETETRLLRLRSRS